MGAAGGDGGGEVGGDEGNLRDMADHAFKSGRSREPSKKPRG